MKTKISNYTFDKTARTVTFTDYTSINLESVLGVVNTTSNVVIYDFISPSKGGSVLNNVLTLTHDTSSMNNADKLLIYYDDVVDGKVCQSASIATISQGAAIDTSGYGSMVAQFSGTWVGKIYFETSNDNVFWDGCFILSRDEISLQDVIDSNGTYSIKRAGRYIRYNCQKISGTAVMVLVGREGEGLSAADLLSFAMDRTNQTPLQVQLPKDLKQDPVGALVLADMFGPISWNSPNASSPMVIDCTGYSSVIIQKTTAGIVTPTVSLDGINYVGTIASVVTSATGAAATIPTAAGIYIIPVVARYLKLTGPASSVQCTIYLSVTPFVQDSNMLNPPVNLTQVGGTAITGSAAGTQSVGGPVAEAAAALTYPVLMGGVDDTKGISAATTKLTRRALIDAIGRLQIGTTTGQIPGAHSSKALNEIGYLADYKNVLEVQDTNRVFGQNTQEFLWQVLQELKILNQQIYELPRILQTGHTATDEPEQFREEPSIFNN
jgi:hypothetical protein